MLTTVSLLFVFAASLATAGAQPVGDAAALATFGEAVEEYVALHRQLEGPVPTIEGSDDADAIRRAMHALGAKIRARRKDAKAGDIFTPAVTRAILSRIDAGCGGDVDAVYEAVHDETPPFPRPQVNGRWPGRMMTFMPPNVLCQLPSLPEELEFRFINRDLVLWDAHADLIVDVLPGALRRKR